MSKKSEMIGKKFGKIVVLSIAWGTKDGVLTVCDCGKESVKLASGIRRGDTRSCGCGEWDGCTKHRMTDTPTWSSWDNMHNRCNPNNNQHCKSYVGITVCPRWCGEDGFVNFLADMGERPYGKTLDRKNNSLGYSKENCRWATRKEQQNNLSVTRKLTYEGVTKTVAEWAETLNIPYETLSSRVKLGWSDNKCITFPYTPKKQLTITRQK